MRREMSRYNILTVAPDEQESKLLHSLFLEIREGTLKGVSMAETLRQSTRLMHPQFRNIHNKIFYKLILQISFSYVEEPLQVLIKLFLIEVKVLLWVLKLRLKIKMKGYQVKF